jgi:methionine synthase I (cobalamin-dependent)
MKNVTFEDKWSMTEAIRTLDQTALEKIIEIVREKSPESIETLDTDKIKIKLDVISRETFNQIQTIIDESSLESLPQKKP